MKPEANVPGMSRHHRFEAACGRLPFWLQLVLCPLFIPAVAIYAHPILQGMILLGTSGLTTYLKVYYLPEMTWPQMMLLGSGHLWGIVAMGYLCMGMAGSVLVPCFALLHVIQVGGRWRRGDPIRFGQLDWPMPWPGKTKITPSGVYDPDLDSRGI